MLLDVPFYTNTNDGNQCYQVCMQAVLDYYLGKKYSVEELDKLTKRKTGMWTWTTQIVPVLYDLGLEVKYYSKDNPELFSGGEKAIRDYFGQDAEKILEHTNVPVMIESIKNCQKYNLFEERVLPFKEIEDHISQNHVVLALIDWNIVAEKEDLFEGHMVVVTGFDESNVYYHESGPVNPQPNKKVSKKLFVRAWNEPSTGNDLVIVMGKRS